jgi:hypothetical protein
MRKITTKSTPTMRTARSTRRRRRREREQVRGATERAMPRAGAGAGASWEMLAAGLLLGGARTVWAGMCCQDTLHTVVVNGDGLGPSS